MSWRDIEEIACPDLPTAKAALKQARAPLVDALARWREQQARTDAADLKGTPRPAPSEYRIRMSKDGTAATVQFRQVPREQESE